MSTLRLTVGLLLLTLLLGLAGCSSTSRFRTAATPKMRTIASVGDRRLPVVSGEPGDSMTAENDTPERRPRADSEGRVSGRVVDENDEPVANARVRLAVSSASGGRVVRDTTDRGGGFTLRGLRPGSTYTVIAEWEDAQGVLTGRRKVEAPDTDVRIALVPADAAESIDYDSSKRVNQVSRRGEVENPAEDQVADVVDVPINVEDLPPAPEADDVPPASRRQADREGARRGPAVSSRTGTWRSGGGSRVASKPNPAPSADADADFERASAPRRGGGADFAVEETPEDEDGHNPLPPALEPGQTSLDR